MFICSACSFASTRKREWERHSLKYGHELAGDVPVPSPARSSSLDVSVEEVMDVGVPTISDELEPALNVGFLDPVQADPSGDETDEDPQGPWFPFKSRAHFYLTSLYHGSHRRYYLRVVFYPFHHSEVFK